MQENLESYVYLQTKNDMFNDFDNDYVDEDLSIHHRVPLALQNIDWNDLPDILHTMDFKLIDKKSHEIFQREKKLLLSIRHKLNKYKYTLRISYKSNNYQVFKTNDLKQQEKNYITKMKIYSFIQKLNSPHPEKITQQCLATVIDRVETTLHDLYRLNYLNNIQYTIMFRECAQTQLNYLYFVPDNDKETLILRPIIVCNNGPTISIATYLSKLLWNIFDRVTYCQKFSEGVDIVQALEKYSKNNLLLSTTLFVTFSMDNICNAFPHTETLIALEHFLEMYASINEDFQYQGLSIETILRLVRLVLDNQYFVYDNSLYRQTIGGASGSPLTLPLAYIYLYYWSDIFFFLKDSTKNSSEIFGRHLNEGFLTWNGTKENLLTLFTMTTNEKFHPSFRIPISFGSTVHFNHIYLSHQNGIFHTKIYHYPNFIEDRSSFIVPIDPIYSNLQSIRKILIQTICCCSNLNDFWDELNRIHLACISNGFSMTTLRNCIQEIFMKFTNSYTYLFFSNQNEYKNFRYRILEYQQQFIEFKQQQKLDQKNKFIFYYSTEYNIDTVLKIKEDYNKIYKDWCEHDAIWKQIKFILVPYQPLLLATSDFIINKRPPLHLLTLSETDTSDDDDDDNDTCTDIESD